MKPLLLLLATATLAGCGAPGAGPGAAAGRYVIGEPYQEGGIWRYPREQFDYTDTGLAIVATRPPGLTADGEVYDDSALAAAHRTLQLPAIARVTNLETGREVVVRLNDRGPAEPGRLIALTRRAVELLGASGAAPFQVRVQLLEAESRQLAATLALATPLPVATAPLETVDAEGLALPDGARQSARVQVASAGPSVTVATAIAAPAAVPLRLPEEVREVAAAPGALYVECGSFARLEYAAILQRRLAGMGARVSTDYGAPRAAAFRVRIGPLRSVADADAALDRALRAGLSDARIIVDDR